ncbi:hypothetical protein BESB_061830 [Besnoitia besnoiti]|uniref:Spatacsin C-terminal domain-containing protein n=1 Tax=Besnoitia besnoiti TaxID=94643 RepID=A0A2A9MH58_BESBE|nr:hypothetical protein BESB_061830 [Besnoitia besnoiti]PFH35296.1 hypothetical protein BESB_061830 [Besnoitia besnoiti]
MGSFISRAARGCDVPVAFLSLLLEHDHLDDLLRCCQFSLSLPRAPRLRSGAPLAPSACRSSLASSLESSVFSASRGSAEAAPADALAPGSRASALDASLGLLVSLGAHTSVPVSTPSASPSVAFASGEAAKAHALPWSDERSIAESLALAIVSHLHRRMCLLPDALGEARGESTEKKRVQLDVLVKAHVQLGLTSELASLLQEEAFRCMECIGRDIDVLYSEAGEDCLLLTLQLFLESSRFFLAAGCLQLHLTVNRLAALVALQLKAVEFFLSLRCLARKVREHDLARRARILRLLDRVPRPSSAGAAETPAVFCGDEATKREPRQSADAPPVSRTALTRDAFEGGVGGQDGSAWLEGGAASNVSELAPSSQTPPLGDLVQTLLFELSCEEATMRSADATQLEEAREASGGAPSLASCAARDAGIWERRPERGRAALFASSGTSGGFQQTRRDSLARRGSLPSLQSGERTSSGVQPGGAGRMGAGDYRQCDKVRCEGAVDDDDGRTITALLAREKGAGDTLLSPFKVVHLSLKEVLLFIEVHPDAMASVIVARAYDHIYGGVVNAAWPRAIFRHCVLRGDPHYREQLQSLGGGGRAPPGGASRRAGAAPFVAEQAAEGARSRTPPPSQSDAGDSAEEGERRCHGRRSACAVAESSLWKTGGFGNEIMAAVVRLFLAEFGGGGADPEKAASSPASLQQGGESSSPRGEGDSARGRPRKIAESSSGLVLVALDARHAERDLQGEKASPRHPAAVNRDAQDDSGCNEDKRLSGRGGAAESAVWQTADGHRAAPMVGEASNIGGQRRGFGGRQVQGSPQGTSKQEESRARGSGAVAVWASSAVGDEGDTARWTETESGNGDLPQAALDLRGRRRGEGLDSASPSSSPAGWRERPRLEEGSQGSAPGAGRTSSSRGDEGASPSSPSVATGCGERRVAADVLRARFLGKNVDLGLPAVAGVQEYAVDARAGSPGVSPRAAASPAPPPRASFFTAAADFDFGVYTFRPSGVLGEIRRACAAGRAPAEAETLAEEIGEKFRDRCVSSMKDLLVHGVENLELRLQFCRLLGPSFADVTAETCEIVDDASLYPPAGFLRVHGRLNRMAAGAGEAPQPSASAGGPADRGASAQAAQKEGKKSGAQPPAAADGPAAWSDTRTSVEA